MDKSVCLSGEETYLETLQKYFFFRNFYKSLCFGEETNVETLFQAGAGLLVRRGRDAEWRLVTITIWMINLDDVMNDDLDDSTQ